MESLPAISGANQPERQTILSGRPAISLLIADDSPMNCQMLRSVFTRSRSTFRIVGSAVSLAEIPDFMASRHVDVALINESLQDGPLTGFRVLSELHASFPKTRLIVLLKSSNHELVVDAFRAGARGVFCRAQSLKDLCKCVTSVHQGQIWADSRQLNAVLDAFVGAAPLRLVNSKGRAVLTKREDEVAALVVEGYTNREVAEKLGLTEHTISNYLFRIYEKLGISGRVELVLYSMKSPKINLEREAAKAAPLNSNKN